MERKQDYVIGSHNIFADLDLPNPEELQTKTKLTLLIKKIIKQRDWTQQQAADALGIKQPDVSALTRGKKLEHYSIERLMQFLRKLEQDVTMTITVKSNELAPEGVVIAESQLAKDIHVAK